MCTVTRGLCALVGRIALCAIFLISALMGKIPHFNDTVEKMTEHGVPLPTVSLIITIVLLSVGSVFVIIGYRARFGALLLFVFLVAATFYFHDFWNMDAENQRVQQIMFMKNISMMGGMLFVIAVGAGPWSIDDCCGAKAACEISKE